MIHDKDIIRDILISVVECLRNSGDGTFSEQVAIHIMEVEPEKRHDWGGEQVTIAKRAPMLRAAKEKVRAEIGIKSVAELQGETGVSRRTLYRWIKPKVKK